MLKIKESYTYVIAEMANAHDGDAKIAQLIVRGAIASGADAVKFQLFTADELAVRSHPKYEAYHQYRLSPQVWVELARTAHEAGLDVLADIFGLDSLKLAGEIDVDGIKVHSADLNNHDLLRRLAATGKQMLLSTGGSTKIEVAEAIEIVKSVNDFPTILLHGFQSFPTRLSDSNLDRIATLKSRFGLPVGFASHVDGATEWATALPLMAIAAGAELIEVHITEDRSRKGSDYFSSLEPPEFLKLVEKIRESSVVAGSPSLQLVPDEIEYRYKMKKCLVAARDVAAGERIAKEDLAYKRVAQPPVGGTPLMEDIVGRIANGPIAKESTITRMNTKIKIAATLACRAESLRLYGKPLQLVGEEPILTHLIAQLRTSKLIEEMVLAISEGPSKAIFIDYAEKHGLPYIIGDEKDVLGRLIQAADLVGADIAVRRTTENPYMFFEEIDNLINAHIENNADYTVLDKLPLGTTLEVISVSALKQSHKYGEDRHRSELCTMYIKENPDTFKIQRILPPVHLQRPDIRLTVDTPEDLIVVRTIWDELYREGQMITLDEIVQFLDTNPKIAELNKQFSGMNLWR